MPVEFLYIDDSHLLSYSSWSSSYLIRGKRNWNVSCTELISLMICRLLLLLQHQKELQILCFWTLSTSCLYLKCRPVYLSKHNVSDTGFCLHLQVRLPRWDIRCPEIGTSSIDWTQLSRSYLKTETESGLRNVAF
jgi:hypothetical protein